MLTIAELGAYLSQLGSSVPDIALRLAILTGGQRMAQLLRATTGDFDSISGHLRLWDGKGRRRSAREHILPLAPRATELVTQLAARATEIRKSEVKAEPQKCAWLFSTHGRIKLTDTTLSNRISEIAKSLGGETFNLRDLRRTVETQLASMQVSKDIRAQLLSHGLGGVQSAHYDRHEYLAEKAATLLAWEAWVSELEQKMAPPPSPAIDA